jgi:hypothetical protein
MLKRSATRLVYKIYCPIRRNRVVLHEKQQTFREMFCFYLQSKIAVLYAEV